MAEKYRYIITSKKSDFYNIQVIKDELFTDTTFNTQVNKKYIPDRHVNRNEPTPLNPSGSKIDTLVDLFSSRSCVAWLTIKEASALKSDPRILGVERVDAMPEEYDGVYTPSLLGGELNNPRSPKFENTKYFSYSTPNNKNNARTTSSATPEYGGSEVNEIVSLFASNDGYTEDSATPIFSGSVLESSQRFGNPNSVGTGNFTPFGYATKYDSKWGDVNYEDGNMAFYSHSVSESLNWGLMAHSVSDENFTKYLASIDDRFQTSQIILDSNIPYPNFTMTSETPGFDDSVVKYPNPYGSSEILTIENPAYINNFPELKSYRYTVDGSGVDFICWEGGCPRGTHTEFDRWHNKWNPAYPDASALAEWGYLADYNYYQLDNGSTKAGGDLVFSRFQASTLWSSGSYNRFATSSEYSDCYYNPYKLPGAWKTDLSCPGPGSGPASFMQVDSLDIGSHATSTTGTAVGNLHGWAKGANLYWCPPGNGQYPHFLNETQSVTYYMNSIEGAVNAATAIKKFHEEKPIDPRTGFKRPTIVNASWSLYNTGHVRTFVGSEWNIDNGYCPDDYKSNSHITELFYSGNLTTYAQPNENYPSLEWGIHSAPSNNTSASFAEIQPWLNTLTDGDQMSAFSIAFDRLGLSSPAVDAACEEMCDAGVIFIKTAGNNNNVSFRANLEEEDPNCEDFYKSIHYDNYFKLDIPYGYGSTQIPAGDPIYYHRHPSPICHQALSVGALKRGWGNNWYDGIHHNQLKYTPASFSSRGAVDVWAVDSNQAAGFSGIIQGDFVYQEVLGAGLVASQSLGWIPYGTRNIPSALNNCDPITFSYREDRNNPYLGINTAQGEQFRNKDFISQNTGAGTSFSAPQVAGVACLFFQLNPGADVNQFKKFIKQHHYPVAVSNEELSGKKDNWVNTRTYVPHPSTGTGNTVNRWGIGINPVNGTQPGYFKAIPQCADGTINKDWFKAPPPPEGVGAGPDQPQYYNQLPDRDTMEEIFYRFNSPALYGSAPRALKWPYATKLDETGVPVAGQMQGNIKVEGAVRFE